jgi:hypothetical protein
MVSGGEFDTLAPFLFADACATSFPKRNSQESIVHAVHRSFMPLL